MRVLVSTQPAPSHFGPLVPYLEALRDAGHEVLVACAASFTGAVEDKGYAAVACGMDWLEVEAAKTFPEVDELDGRGKLLFSLRHMFGGVLADAFARDLPAVIEDWGADVLLWEGAEFGGHVAAEKAGIPHLPVPLGVRPPPAVIARVMGEQFAARRAAHGLPADPGYDAPYRHGCASLFPPQWLPAQDPKPLAGERFFHPVPDYRPRRDIAEPPLVYLSLGTVVYDTPGVMETMIEGLRDGPWELTAAIGRTRDPADFGPQPPNVRLLPFAPQRDILSRCALAVHHGGFSSTMECLSAGAPQLVVPLTGDQGSHADAVARHGLGSVLEHALGQGAFGLPLTDPARLDPAQVLAEARALMADSAVGGRVADFRRQVDELPGRAEFAAFVEELAGG